MSLTRFYVLHCDRCGQEFQEKAVEDTLVVAHARNAGWYCKRSELHYCPSCKVEVKR